MKITRREYLPAKTGNMSETIIFTIPPCCSRFSLFSWASSWLSHPLYSSYLLCNLVASSEQMSHLLDTPDKAFARDKSINQTKLRSSSLVKRIIKSHYSLRRDGFPTSHVSASFLVFEPKNLPLSQNWAVLKDSCVPKAIYLCLTTRGGPF